MGLFIGSVNEAPNLQVLVVFAIMALAAGMADANLPLESGRSRGDEHTAAGAEAGLGSENDARLPVGTSGGRPPKLVRPCNDSEDSTASTSHKLAARANSTLC